MSDHEGDERSAQSDDEVLERISAYLDGEAEPAEAARIEADPALRQRAAELAAAREVIAAPFPALDESSWDELVAGARAQVAAESPAPVIDLRARGRTRSLVVAVVGVAAACLLVVAIVATLARRPGGDPRPDELAGPTSSAEVTTTTEQPGGVNVAGSGTTSPNAAADEFRSVYSREPLGSFADAGELASAAARASGQPAPPGTAAPGDPTVDAIARCVAAVRRGEPRLGRIRFAANATYQDKPVFVLVFQDFGIGSGAEPRRVVAVGRDSCAIAASAPL